MKFFGDINLQKNKLKNAALEDLTYFPANPVIGMLAFVNKIVYVCIGVQDNPMWIPLTREITAHSHIQNISSTEWIINHNLNTTLVAVQIYDGDNNMILPDSVEVLSNTSVKVSFDAPQYGRAILLSGHIDGGLKPIYGLTIEQTEPSTTWKINHAFGYYPIVRVFVDGIEVQPLQIVNDDLFNITITFNTPTVGTARLL